MWKTLAAAMTATLMISAGSATTLHQQAPAADPRIANGRALFVTYCATCHGTSARGDGPVGERFRIPPADLTQLAKQTGGAFVAVRIQRIVDGREVKSHGNVDMPVWGDAFKRREGLSEDAVRARIEAIVRYLESIQERSS